MGGVGAVFVSVTARRNRTVVAMQSWLVGRPDEGLGSRSATLDLDEFAVPRAYDVLDGEEMRGSQDWTRADRNGNQTRDQFMEATVGSRKR